MTYRSHPAYFASVFLHAAVVGVVLVFAYLSAKKRLADTPQIFELVAGEGDNYAATEAPALGTPGGVKIEVPAIPQPQPAPAAPVQEPVIAPAPEPVKAAPPPTPVIPNMARNVERLADKREANIRKQIEREQKAEAARQKKAEEQAQQKRLTKEEFDRLNAGKTKAAPKAAAPGPIRTAKIDAEGIAKGVVGGSTANKTGGAGGTALTRQEGDLTQAYIALIIQRIRQALESASFNDLFEVTVQFQVSATGAISNARIQGSSGSAEFDRAILNALQTIRPIGPPPTGKAETFRVPIRLRERG